MRKQPNPNNIVPRGWIRRQLQIQADSLSGNLYKIWPDVRDSRWIGGDREGWERVPYWLDGFIPLAWLLDDKEKKAVAKKYIDAIIDRQQPDGWICPCTQEDRPHYDLWAYLLIGKVLALYCSFTEDERAADALHNSFRCLYNLLLDGTVRLGGWGKSRWFEGLIPIKFLIDRYHEDWLVDLGKILKEQGTDWYSMQDRWVKHLCRWTQETHIVNIEMMLKYEAMYCEVTGEPYEGIADKLLAHLDKYNGNAVGTVNGDECLAGIRNNRGFELCSVVEMMYSMEILYRFTGDVKWAERLEKVAFNAMPATFTDDMWGHQYDQQVNQIECVPMPGKSFFGTNRSDAHTFGLEPSYGCCTANFNQGWPKFAMSIFYETDEGIEASHLLPGEIKFEKDGKTAIIRCISDYPFRNTARYEIETEDDMNFRLDIRIPKFTEKLTVDGTESEVRDFVSFDRTWSGKTVITIGLEYSPKINERPFELKTVSYGNLVFAKQIEAEYEMREYEDNNVPRKFPYCDYYLHRKSEWRYGFASDKFVAEPRFISGIPFSSVNPPIVLKTKLAAADWETADGYNGVAEYKPESDKAMSDAFDAELVPYGCAKLRLTEMPMLKFE